MRQAQDRHAARVLLLDPEDRVLMLKCRSGDPSHAPHFWITPGGGLEADETHVSAATRELREEVGLELDGLIGQALGPHVWSRVHTFPWLGRMIRQHERFYLCRAARLFEPVNHHQTEEELNFLLGHRWWSAEELIASDEAFAPREIGALLQRLLRDGAPAKPIEIGA